MMTELQEKLRGMKDFEIACGPSGADPEEIIIIKWTADDKNYNVG